MVGVVFGHVNFKRLITKSTNVEESISWCSDTHDFTHTGAEGENSNVDGMMGGRSNDNNRCAHGYGDCKEAGFERWNNPTDDRLNNNNSTTAASTAATTTIPTAAMNDNDNNTENRDRSSTR